MIAQDVITALAALVDRAGGKALEIGYLNDNDNRPDWHASVQYQGARLSVEGHKTPTAAALELAERILDHANCRCGRLTTLDDDDEDDRPVRYCRWRLVGPRWEPGCDADPIKARNRGDLQSLRDAYKTTTGKEPRK